MPRGRSPVLLQMADVCRWIMYHITRIGSACTLRFNSSMNSHIRLPLDLPQRTSVQGSLTKAWFRVSLDLRASFERMTRTHGSSSALIPSFLPFLYPAMLIFLLCVLDSIHHTVFYYPIIDSTGMMSSKRASIKTSGAIKRFLYLHAVSLEPALCPLMRRSSCSSRMVECRITACKVLPKFQSL